ncbi:hypothetical protein [Mycobacteroides abscessus]|uniref:hypothetical protein n=1 Tax=Mycobacteroides abscessus TaxID=36809 RepID=UPI0012FF4D38|nr:hypothetical protein [Mycobacteroides abscessus]
MRFRDARGPEQLTAITPPPSPPPPIAAGADPVSRLVAAASQANKALYEKQLELYNDAKRFEENAAAAHADLKATDTDSSKRIARSGTFEV